MYYVDVYEEDRKTVSEVKEFLNMEVCRKFAKLNQPSVVFTVLCTSTDCVYRNIIGRYGMEDKDHG